MELVKLQSSEIQKFQEEGLDGLIDMMTIDKK